MKVNFVCPDCGDNRLIESLVGTQLSIVTGLNNYNPNGPEELEPETIAVSFIDANYLYRNFECYGCGYALRESCSVPVLQIAVHDCASLARWLRDRGMLEENESSAQNDAVSSNDS